MDVTVRRSLRFSTLVATGLYGTSPVVRRLSTRNLHASAFSRSLSLAWLQTRIRPLLHLHGVLPSQPSSASVIPPPSSLLQFISHRISHATHRSRISHVRPSGNGSYQPPPNGFWQQLRRRIDALPAGLILWGVIGLNGAVFLAWQAAEANYKGGDPTLFIKMRQNFTVSADNIRSGRVWTLLTACFSHSGVAHVLFNGLTYYFMAPSVLGALGNTAFLGLYLGGGIFSSLASYWWHNRMRHDPHYSSHGASGAVYAVISCSACLQPTATFLLMGVIPFPAWLFVTGIFAYDGYNAWTDRRNGIDAAGHIGGILAGIGYFIRKRFGRF